MTSPLWLLMRLKWTLIWRGFRRSRASAVGTIISMLILLPLSGYFGFFLWEIGRNQPIVRLPLAEACLTALFLLWAITPLLGFSFNEAFDLTRLFLYPISPLRLMAANLLAALADRSVVLTFPIFVSLVAIFTHSIASGIACIALALLFLALACATGQCITLLMIGLLRSRRYRDLTIVLLPAIGMTFYVAQRLFFQRVAAGETDFTTILRSPIWSGLRWIPSGWAASAMLAASQGRGLAAAAGACALLLAMACILLLSAQAMVRLYFGESTGLTVQPSIVSSLRPLSESQRVSLTSWLPLEIAVFVQKERTYLLRDPQYKAFGVQTAYVFVCGVIPILLPSIQNEGFSMLRGGWICFYATGIMMMSISPLLFNQWAGEGSAIASLFSFPARRRNFILGKNIAYGSAFLTVCLIAQTAAAIWSRAWADYGLSLAWDLLSLPLLLAAGNLLSIRFPSRTFVRGQRWGRRGATVSDDPGAGCAYSLLYILGGLATVVALLPAAAAIALPGLGIISERWLLLTIPAALAYSVALYIILLGQADSWLSNREIEIIGRIGGE